MNLISGENLCKPRINYISALELLKRVYAQITDDYGTAGQIMARHRRVTLLHSVYKQFIVVYHSHNKDAAVSKNFNDKLT